MTDQVTQPVVDEEAQALEAAQAGYSGKARAQAPAEPEPVKPAPLAEQPATPTEPEEDADPEPAAQAVTPEKLLAAQLDDLRAQVREMRENGADAKTVRKMDGEIGEINRTLKELHAAAKANTPEEVDELTAALKEAEEAAKEYPEINGPALKLLKVMQSRMAEQQKQPEAVIPAAPTAPAAQPEAQKSQYTKEQLAMIAALDEAVPDRQALLKDPEYNAWLAKQPPAYQSRLKTSWNPVVAAQPFTDFKAFKAAQQRKKDRLEAAVTPQGTPQQAQPTTLPDAEGARIGYERARRKRL